jgi:uncharacterized protein (TIGR02118 family)
LKETARRAAPSPEQPYVRSCQNDNNDLGSSGMASLVVMYKTPTDPQAFHKYYAETHIPIAQRVPGLLKYEVSKGSVMTPDGPSAYQLVAILRFDDMAALQAALASAEGHAAVADVQNFATGGVDIYMFDDKEA